jgi:hypothetical protein
MRNLSLTRRIARLEVQCARPVHREPLVMLVDFGGADDSKQDGSIVIDVFRNSGSVCWARERAAHHPGDTGHRCEPGRHLPDILCEIHESCPWNKDPGVCRLCQGTPIATPSK